MFKKLADRRILIVTVIVLLVFIGVIAILLNGKMAKDPDKHPNKDIIEQNQDEEPYDGDGLEVQKDEETLNGKEQQEEGVKAPSAWEGGTTEDVQNPDTTDKSEQDSDDKGNMDSNDLPDEEQDTLWGTIF